MNWLARGLGSSIGSKYLMALTGLFLLLFVVGHLVGNLQVFAGQEAINSYAAMLKGLGPLLWVMRGGLLLILLIHVRTAVKLTAENRAARPVQYAGKEAIVSSYASRTMFMTGMIVLAFIVFHLLHFTLGFIHNEHFVLKDAMGRHDVYSMFVKSFMYLPTVVAYLVAMAFLGLHLSHGISSLFQSMGWVRPKYRDFIAKSAVGLTALLVLGNMAMPIACYLGIIKTVGGES